MILDKNQHSVYLLYYHLILVVKYRGKVFDDIRSNYAKNMFERIGKNYGITLMEWSYDIDHINIKFKAKPETELSKFINAYKSASSRVLKKEFPEIKNYLWKEMFWSKSFCLLTIGEATLDVIKKYVESQERKKYI